MAYQKQVVLLRLNVCNHSFNCKLGKLSFDDLSSMPCPICYKKSLWDKWKQEMLIKYKIKSLLQGSFYCIKRKGEKRPKMYWVEGDGHSHWAFKLLKNALKYTKKLEKEQEKFFFKISYKICFKLNGMAFKYPLSVWEKKGSYWIFEEAQSMSRILK